MSVHVASELFHVSPDLMNGLSISRDRCQKRVVLGKGNIIEAWAP